jgi:hypothetical protein
MPAYRRLNYAVCEPDLGIGFSHDITKNIYLGHSVIFSAIQIASFLGAKRTICLGIDMNYSGNHNYFDAAIPRGAWDGFDYEIHGRKMFEHFRFQYESMGKQLINATPGGKVDVLERLVLEAALR